MPETRTLDEVLTDVRQELQTLRRNGASMSTARAEELLDVISKTTEPFRRFVPELEARLFTGRSVAWLRARFIEWEARGHAYKRAGKRYYRLIVLPRRADLEAAYAAGLAGETDSAHDDDTRASA